MEGNLQKWTNYWKGWQQRYFVLKDGVLAYFNTESECKSGAGCKRAYKISMFDIIVNKSDNTRVDLIVANDQHLYLKASDYKERQKWLVALASQKAIYPSSTINAAANSTAAAAAINNSNNTFQQIEQIEQFHFGGLGSSELTHHSMGSESASPSGSQKSSSSFNYSQHLSKPYSLLFFFTDYLFDNKFYNIFYFIFIIQQFDY
jgi:hypothetical protein